MNFVHNNRSNTTEHGSDVLTGEKQLECFRGRHQQIWWAPGLLGPLRLGRVPVAHIHTQTDRLCQFG